MFNYKVIIENNDQKKNIAIFNHAGELLKFAAYIEREFLQGNIKRLTGQILKYENVRLLSDNAARGIWLYSIWVNKAI